MAAKASPDISHTAARQDYLVVARRYRPQTFEELIGQEHVARGLAGAIASGRVGHAYLFTGARGVGKTSAARILAKALNCEQGPTADPCNRCDICESISSGDDVDVLEIDGASNRGIDEIRQLRQNVNVRPSRARFKVYIIDEVHMLTTPAFNALLKTLEEPPEHVKFIFCTTEAEKIPITILSRCQRYDFAGIQLSSIARRLEQIAAAEGVEVEPEALAILARRAAGSMRDSQSLLEQLLACGDQRITAAMVNGMLGTAGSERLLRLLDHLVDRNAAEALVELDAALAEGVDAGQLLDQLLGYLRDLMVAAVGCNRDALLQAAGADAERLASAAQALGLETILAAMQIVDQTLNRMRFSTQSRILAELALVRLARLEDLESLALEVAQLREGNSNPSPEPARHAPPGVKKNGESLPSSASGKATSPRLPSTDNAEGSRPIDTVPANVAALTEENVAGFWSQALSKLGGFVEDMAGSAARLELRGPTHVVAYVPRQYNSLLCERPEQATRVEQALSAVCGQSIRVQLLAESGPDAASAAEPRRASPHRKRQAELRQQPFVRQALALFDATIVDTGH